MNPETAKLIQDIANKLGTTAEYLWPKLCGHVRVDALMGIVLSGLVILVAMAVTVTGVTMFVKYRLSEDDDKSDLCMGGLFASVIAIVVMFFAFWGFADNVPYYFYPESRAINTLLGR